MERKSLSALALGAILALSSVVPATAMPAVSQPAQPVSQIEQVKVIIKYGSYRGYRGYRDRRAGYRRHTDGYWYPNAAFTIRFAPGVRVKVGARHAGWCRDRYRTYRVSDNTYVVSGGVRRVCRSPY